MAKRLAQADRLDVERIARGVPGVAYAEVVDSDDRRSLSVVVWQDAVGEEVAGRVEIALREAGWDLQAGDVRLAGVANQQVSPEASPGRGVRVVDLGQGTWATESADDPLSPIGGLPSGDLPRAVSLVSVTVSRSPDRCRARVEVDAGDAIRVGDSSGPATDARMRRAVCEATAKAVSLAIGVEAADVEEAVVVQAGAVSCALVVLALPGGGRRLGSAIIDGDPVQSFALATLAAASS